MTDRSADERRPNFGQQRERMVWICMEKMAELINQRTQTDGTCSPFCVQFDHPGTSDEGIIHLERSKLVGIPSVRCDPIRLSEEPLPESDEQEPTGADDDSRENDDNTAGIGACAFMSCSSMASIDLPEGLERIGDSAFGGCSWLNAVAIPGSVTKLGEFAFNFCKGLISVEFSDGITVLESGVFNGCSSLYSVDLPTNLTHIEESAFGNCTAMRSISIPDSVTNIHPEAFESCTDNFVIKASQDSYAAQWAAEAGIPCNNP